MDNQTINHPSQMSENPQSVTTPAPQPISLSATQTIQNPPKRLSLFIIMLIVAIVLLGVIFGVLLVRFLSVSTSPQTETSFVATPSAMVTRTAEEEAYIRENNSWKIYERPEFGYTLSYPYEWMLALDGPLPADYSFLFYLNQGEVVTGMIYDRPATNNNSSTRREIALSPNKTLLINYAQCLGLGCGEGSLDIPTFSLFLDTIKVGENTLPEPSR